MNEQEIIKKIVETTALEAYKDSAKPALQVIGKSLGQCISLFATPLGRTAEILEKNIHKYLDKLEGLKTEELVIPDSRILVPILERMRYTEDEEVSNYYAEILAAASKKETRGRVMLSFIEILNRVTSDEIKILEFINSTKNIGLVEASTVITEEERRLHSVSNENILLPIPLGTAIPIIDVKLETEGKAGYQVLFNNFNTLSENIELEFPKNVDFYLENLISLGLLHITYGKSFANQSIYKTLREHPMVINIQKNLPPKQKITFANSRIELTNLSLRLLSLCSKKLD